MWPHQTIQEYEMKLTIPSACLSYLMKYVYRKTSHLKCILSLSLYKQHVYVYVYPSWMVEGWGREREKYIQRVSTEIQSVLLVNYLCTMRWVHYFVSPRNISPTMKAIVSYYLFVLTKCNKWLCQVPSNKPTKEGKKRKRNPVEKLLHTSKDFVWKDLLCFKHHYGEVAV